MRLVILLAADAVNAGHAGHDHHVAAREQRAHGREPQPLDLLVDARILLDEGVRARDVGLGLVIIEVADEVFDGVVWEEALELGVKLGRQRLVVGDDERGLVHVADDVGDGEGFARTRHPQECLVLRPGNDALGQLGNGLRLIPGGRVGRNEFEHRAKRTALCQPSQRAAWKQDAACACTLHASRIAFQGWRTPAPPA